MYAAAHNGEGSSVECIECGNIIYIYIYIDIEICFSKSYQLISNVRADLIRRQKACKLSAIKSRQKLSYSYHN